MDYVAMIEACERIRVVMLHADIELGRTPGALTDSDPDRLRAWRKLRNAMGNMVSNTSLLEGGTKSLLLEQLKGRSHRPEKLRMRIEDIPHLKRDVVEAHRALSVLLGEQAKLPDLENRLAVIDAILERYEPSFLGEPLPKYDKFRPAVLSSLSQWNVQDVDTYWHTDIPDAADTPIDSDACRVFLRCNREGKSDTWSVVRGNGDVVGGPFGTLDSALREGNAYLKGPVLDRMRRLMDEAGLDPSSWRFLSGGGVCAYSKGKRIDTTRAGEWEVTEDGQTRSCSTLKEAFLSFEPAASFAP